MPNPKARREFILLCGESVQAILFAYESLERGGTVVEAKRRLKAVSKRLVELELQYKGNCSW